MRLLLADDDAEYLDLLATFLEGLDYEIVTVADGDAAWKQLQYPGFPIALLDWEMPGIAGPDLCRRVRATKGVPYTYLMLVTARSARRDLLEGMEAGADDFLTKPVDLDLLRARLLVATRMLAVREALDRLGGFLSICMYCNSVREKDGPDWERIDTYVAQRVGTRFSHGCCPDCVSRLEQDMG